MPVDPNEPTYCLCHQVSYGEMIGCDNPDVRSRRCLFCRSFFVPSHLNPFFLTVPNWMVPLCVRQFNNQTQRKMVLSKVLSRQEKEVISESLSLVLSRLLIQKNYMSLSISWKLNILILFRLKRVIHNQNYFIYFIEWGPYMNQTVCGCSRLVVVTTSANRLITIQGCSRLVRLIQQLRCSEPYHLSMRGLSI